MTRNGAWPIEETPGIWKQFREEALTGHVQHWLFKGWHRNVDKDIYILSPSPGYPYGLRMLGMMNWTDSP